MTATWLGDLQRGLFTLWVASRYGAAPLFRSLFRRSLDPADTGARLRGAFEELGLTYMKLGQYLASRLDLIPEGMSQELNRLFEQASPVPFDAIRREVETELLRPVEEVFAEFNPEPIAAASVAQVHRARTRSGQEVAVKIQRPGVAHIFGADMRNLRRVTTVVDRLGILGTFSAGAVVNEFARWTARELDFVTEGRTADRLRRESLKVGTVPRVHWNLTSKRVLTLEFVDGLSLARIAEMIENHGDDFVKKLYPQLDIHEAVENLASIIMHQLFVTGFFHGDPHPGNIFVRADNSIVLLDFGIFGELNKEQRGYLAGHIESVAIGDIDAGFRFYAKQLTPTDQTDMKAFENDGKAVLRRWYEEMMNPEAKPEDQHLGKYAGQMLTVVRKHHVRISTDTLLFWRSLEALDATALRFSKYFDLLKSMRTFFERIRPSAGERVWRVATDRALWQSMLRLVQDAPRQADSILQNLARQTPFETRVQETDSTRRDENRRARDIAFLIFGLGAAVLAAGLRVEVAFHNALLTLGAALIVIPAVRLWVG